MKTFCADSCIGSTNARGDDIRISVINNNTLFVQYHEQEIPEVIPIEGIPFVNQSKSNQLNSTQIKSNQILVFEERGKPEYPEKNLSEQSREPTNSAHI